MVGREPDAIVVVPCRDKGGSGTAALQKLIDAGAAVRVMRMDLASLQSVRDFVADCEAAQLPPVKGLVCNAGLLQVQAPSSTADGFEVRLALEWSACGMATAIECWPDRSLMHQQSTNASGMSRRPIR